MLKHYECAKGLLCSQVSHPFAMTFVAPAGERKLWVKCESFLLKKGPLVPRIQRKWLQAVRKKKLSCIIHRSNMENTHHESAKGLFCFSTLQKRCDQCESVKGPLVPRFAWKKKAQNRWDVGLNFNKCFSSVVEAKTKSAAEVAFEKAQLKKFFCLSGQMSKPRGSSLRSWSFLGSSWKMWSYLALRKKCLKRSLRPEKNSISEGSWEAHQFSEKAFEMPK